MEIRQLRYFVGAAACLNFTKAAKECFIAQSSMTEQIANLENELGVKLFDRQHKGLTLTKAGEFFLPRAKRILSEVQKGQEEMSSFRAGYRGFLRIGYHGELFKEELTRSLRGYRKDFPAVRMALRQLPEEELLEGLRDGQFDVIIIPFWDMLAVEKEWMEWEVIDEMGPALVMAKDHPLAGRESISTAEVENLSLISFGDSGSEDLKAGMALNGDKLQNVAQARDHTSNEILLASGYGVSLWAERLARRTRTLKCVEISDYPVRKKFILAWKQGKLTSEGENFCRRFLEECKGDV